MSGIVQSPQGFSCVEGMERGCAVAKIFFLVTEFFFQNFLDPPCNFIPKQSLGYHSSIMHCKPTPIFKKMYKKKIIYIYIFFFC